MVADSYKHCYKEDIAVKSSYMDFAYYCMGYDMLADTDCYMVDYMTGYSLDTVGVVGRR